MKEIGAGSDFFRCPAFRPWRARCRAAADMVADGTKEDTQLKRWIAAGCVCANMASGGNDDVSAVPVDIRHGLRVWTLCRSGGAWVEASVAPERVFFNVVDSAFDVPAPSTLVKWEDFKGDKYEQGRHFFVVPVLVGRHKLTASDIKRKNKTGALRYLNMARPPRPHRTSVRRRHPRRSSCRMSFS